MGFRKDHAPQTLPVTRRYLQVDETVDMEQYVTVTHVFRIPTAPQRENYQRALAEWKGKKLKTHRGSASWSLWVQIAVDVRGYDDLEEQYPRDEKDKLAEGWKRYFDDESGFVRIHVEDMIETLMEILSGEEASTQKKYELSSELSSQTARNKIPMSTTK